MGISYIKKPRARTFSLRIYVSGSKVVRMQIEELKRGGKIEYKGKCHDCSRAVRVDVREDEETGVLTIVGGAVYNPLVGMPPTERIYLKCDACYGEDRILHNFRECEVYSRVVGYLRPVSGWNKGKTTEWAERKTFKVG